MNKLLILLCVMAAAACQRGRRVTNLPAKPGFVVINSIANNLEPLRVFVTNTAAPGDSTLLFDTSVVVSIYENNVFRASLPFEKSSGGFLWNQLPAGGNTYKIGVRRPGSIADDAWTETTLPQAVTLSAVSYKDSVKTVNGEIISEMRFTITDQPGADRYKLLMYGYIAGQYLPIDATPADAVLSNPDTERDLNAWIFDDTRFSGQSHTFVLHFVGSNFSPAGKPRFVLEMTDANYDYNQYVTSLASYQRQARNPFSNPVPIYTNVYNGLGIFAGYTVAFDTIP